MSDTPRTDVAIQQMFMTTGHVGPHNCPESLVGHSRELERELANMEDQRDAAIWCHEKCREDRLRIIAQRDRLAEAGQAVVDRWHTPLWKDAPHTAQYIQNLEAALDAVKGDAP